MSAKDFDIRAAEFGRALHRAAGWRSNYFGAAYSTRLLSALAEAERACADLRQLLVDDGVLTPAPDSSIPPDFNNRRRG